MMQHAPTRRHIPRHIDTRFTLVRDHAAQKVTATASRQVRRPAQWRAAVRWMLAAGFHPHIGDVTLAVAEDFAARMHRSGAGHIAYGRRSMTGRLGLSQRALANHVRYLRELGLLAWVEHGSRANTNRARGLPGYRGTATIYAAVAPRVWDTTMGRTVTGSGYTARVTGYTPAGRLREIDRQIQLSGKAWRAGRGGSRCTPSLWVATGSRSLSVVGVKNYSPREHAYSRTHQQALPHLAPGADGVSPAQCAHAIDVAAWLTRRIWWLVGARLRETAFALRPMLAAGCSRDDIAAELYLWRLQIPPRDVPGYLHAEIHRRGLHRPGGHRGEAAVCGQATADRLAVDDQELDRARQALATQRAAQQAGVLHRTARLRGQLREAVQQSARKTRGNHRNRAVWELLLREPTEAFAAAWPLTPRVDPREVYARRAHGIDGPPAPAASAADTVTHPDLQVLTDHHAAAKAFEALRAELTQWEHQSRREERVRVLVAS